MGNQSDTNEGHIVVIEEKQTHRKENAMMTKTLTAMALAAGIMMTSATAQATQTSTGITIMDAGIQKVHNKKFKHGFRRRNRNRFGHGIGHRWHGNHGCGYFHRKARWTGSRYWWKQYRRCTSYRYYY